MPILEIIILGVVQALTEFLPISSSGHLYLASLWFGWSYQGLTFDLGLHLGTLIAVLVYFRRDWRDMLSAACRYRLGHAVSQPLHLLLILALATVPATVIGFLISIQDGLTARLRDPVLIGVNLVLFALLLWFAVRRAGARRIEDLHWRDGLIIGLAQAIALVPGVSRSGITMTAGLLRGLDAHGAARFSFLLAVPVTMLAAAKGVKDLIDGVEPVILGDFLLGAAIAALAGLAVVHFLMAFIRRIGLMPFVWYRLALGGGLIIYYAWSHAAV